MSDREYKFRTYEELKTSQHIRKLIYHNSDPNGCEANLLTKEISLLKNKISEYEEIVQKLLTQINNYDTIISNQENIILNNNRIISEQENRLKSVSLLNQIIN